MYLCTEPNQTQCRRPVQSGIVIAGLVEMDKRLPRIITTQGEIITEKSDRRRRLSLAAINRTDISQTTINNIRVCSDHFVSGTRILYS